MVLLALMVVQAPLVIVVTKVLLVTPVGMEMTEIMGALENLVLSVLLEMLVIQVVMPLMDLMVPREEMATTVPLVMLVTKVPLALEAPSVKTDWKGTRVHLVLPAVLATQVQGEKMALQEKGVGSVILAKMGPQVEMVAQVRMVPQDQRVSRETRAAEVVWETKAMLDVSEPLVLTVLKVFQEVTGLMVPMDETEFLVTQDPKVSRDAQVQQVPQVVTVPLVTRVLEDYRDQVAAQAPQVLRERKVPPANKEPLVLPAETVSNHLILSLPLMTLTPSPVLTLSVKGITFTSLSRG
jgi:hypothetical protein